MSLRVLTISFLSMFFLIVTLAFYLNWPDRFLHVIACDVGQGDGVLVTFGFTQILIDAGPDEKILACLRHYLPFWDRNLEMVVATHAHQDHIGGMPSLFRQYQVSSLLLTAQTERSDDFREFRTAVRDLQQQGTILLAPRLGKQISLPENMTLQVIWPLKTQNLNQPFLEPLTETELSAYFEKNADQEKTANDGSIGLLLKYGNFSFLATGDLEEKSEQTLVDSGLITEVDVLKAGHHGSKTSSTLAFLSQTQPEITLISCGQKNRYGHPHTETLDRLEAVGSQVLRTDQLGHIELQTNGDQIWFSHVSQTL